MGKVELEYRDAFPPAFRRAEVGDHGRSTAGSPELSRGPAGSPLDPAGRNWYERSFRVPFFQFFRFQERLVGPL